MKFIMLEDHKLVRDGVSSIVEEKSDFECIGTFSQINDALAFVGNFLEKNAAINNAEKLVCIVDLSLGSEDGLEFIRAVKKLDAEKKYVYCVVYSMFTGAGIVEQSVSAGANAYVSKNAGSEELIEAMKKCQTEKFFMERNLTSDYVIYTSLIQSLTKREKELVNLFFAKKTDKEIAETMCISIRAVENYFSRIFSKMGVSGKKELLENFC